MSNILRIMIKYKTSNIHNPKSWSKNKSKYPHSNKDVSRELIKQQMSMKIDLKKVSVPEKNDTNKRFLDLFCTSKSVEKY